MFGIKHIRFDSMTSVLHFKNGEVAKEGRGLTPSSIATIGVAKEIQEL